MNRNFWMVLSISIAITLGALLPQFNLERAEGSPPEVTYQFKQLGLKSAKQLQEIEETFENIVGIVHFEIKAKEDAAIVTFNEETMKAEWIAKTLEARGYPPKKIEKIKAKKR